jgi:hypothetical protein
MYAGSAVSAQSRKPITIRDPLGTAALRRADHSSLLPYPEPNLNLHNDLAESTFGNTNALTALRSS